MWQVIIKIEKKKEKKKTREAENSTPGFVKIGNSVFLINTHAVTRREIF